MVKAKRRTAGPVARGNDGLVHARSNRERVVLEHKQRELRALAASLQSLQETPPKSADDGDVDPQFQQLRELAFSPHGFVSDDIRRKLWPILLGEAGFKPVARGNEDHFTKTNAPHRDDLQIQKDIDRSMWHFDVVTGIREAERRVKRLQLTQVINGVLVDNPDLYYYQGYHDVCSVFLLVLGDQLAFRAVRQFSATYQREPMRKNFELVLHATRLLYPLIESEDPTLFAHMKESGVEPFFALPWMITWFAHQLSRLSDASRLYDVLLVSHPLFILYLSAAVVLDARHRVLKTECDFGTLHGLLAKLPLTMEIERIIPRAALIFHRYPPAQLLAGSEHETELRSSTYALFPFPFHAPFNSIDKEFLPPALYQRRDPIVAVDGSTQKSTGWQSSLLVRAAVIGLVAVSLSFVFRGQLRPWIPLLDIDSTDSSA